MKCSPTRPGEEAAGVTDRPVRSELARSPPGCPGCGTPLKSRKKPLNETSCVTKTNRHLRHSSTGCKFTRMEWKPFLTITSHFIGHVSYVNLFLVVTPHAVTAAVIWGLWWLLSPPDLPSQRKGTTLPDRT